MVFAGDAPRVRGGAAGHGEAPRRPHVEGAPLHPNPDALPCTRNPQPFIIEARGTGKRLGAEVVYLTWRVHHSCTRNPNTPHMSTSGVSQPQSLTWKVHHSCTRNRGRCSPPPETSTASRGRSSPTHETRSPSFQILSVALHSKFSAQQLGLTWKVHHSCTPLPTPFIPDPAPGTRNTKHEARNTETDNRNPAPPPCSLDPLPKPFTRNPHTNPPNPPHQVEQEQIGVFLIVHTQTYQSSQLTFKSPNKPKYIPK